MEYRLLGNTGVFVSGIGMGTMTFGGKGVWQVIGDLQQEEAERMVHRALDRGVNFFDTANVYAYGQAEIMLGKALGARRKEVVLATKVFSRMREGPNQVGLSRVHIIGQLEDSLRRLGTDYIDLYQIHGFDPLTPIEDTLRTLDDLVSSGKVRYLGCSNLAAWQIMKAMACSRIGGWEAFRCCQSYYCIAGRDVEREIIPLLVEENLGLLVWSPLAGGFLSGKYTRETAAPDGRRSKFDFPPVNREKGYDIIDVLREVAVEHDVPVARIALAWLLHQNAVTSVIIGARNGDQLDDNLGAIEVRLGADELERLDAVSRLAPEYPGWMQALPTERCPGEARDWVRGS